jgi:hypothetical protein
MLNVEVTWDNEEKTIIRYKFPKKWTWQDYNDAWNAAVDMMNTVPHQVDFLVDLSESDLLPGGALANTRLSKWESATNAGITVIITRTILVEMLVDTFRRVYSRLGKNFYGAKTLDEGRKLIINNHKPKSL